MADKNETSFDEWKEKELKENPEFAKEYLMSIAKDIKKYCDSQSNCATCHFRMGAPEGGIWFCKLTDGNKTFIPSDWEV